MANDFSADGNCKALWNLESGALTVDSKGSNTLVNQGVDEDNVDFKQGSCSGHFIRANSDRMTLSHANQDSGLPLKGGESNKTFSIPKWFKLDAKDITQYLICKSGGAGHLSFEITIYHNNHIRLIISSDGTAKDTIEHASALAADRWYHLTVTYDGNVDDSYRIRIWDDTAHAIVGADKTGISSDINIENSGYYLGFPSALITLGGNEDEVVIFDRVLSVADIDAIRAGTYGGAPPAEDYKFGSLLSKETIEQNTGVFMEI